MDIARDPLIQTNILTITADEMVWNHDTDEIELRGNVRVKQPSLNKTTGYCTPRRHKRTSNVRL